MSLTYFKKLIENADKKSIAKFFLSKEFAKMIVDGNMAHNNIVRAPQGTQVGTDKYGNKYYEDNEESYARRRWVVYADKFNYNVTSVPPEWHGWVNYVNDFKPTEYDFKKPIYHAEWFISKTGTPDCYQPKGAWANPQQRNWKKVEFWQPPKTA